jgi:hypothetical protein
MTHNTRLPEIGVFEIPPACAGRTRDWIFPASTQGKSETHFRINGPQPNYLPTIEFGNSSLIMESPADVTGTGRNASWALLIQQVLARNGPNLKKLEWSANQLQGLLEEVDATSERYPFEWTIIIVVLVICVFVFSQIVKKMKEQLKILEERLAFHENLDDQPPPDTETPDAAA